LLLHSKQHLHLYNFLYPLILSPTCQSAPTQTEPLHLHFSLQSDSPLPYLGKYITNCINFHHNVN